MEERRSGRSTRQIDAMIQTLFTVGEVRVVDHAHELGFVGNRVRPINMALARTKKILLNRLLQEHNMGRNCHYIYDNEANIIKLIKR